VTEREGSASGGEVVGSLTAPCRTLLTALVAFVAVGTTIMEHGPWSFFEQGALRSIQRCSGKLIRPLAVPSTPWGPVEHH
jgi:hypothetical protein